MDEVNEDESTDHYDSPLKKPSLVITENTQPIPEKQKFKEIEVDDELNSYQQKSQVSRANSTKKLKGESSDFISHTSTYQNLETFDNEQEYNQKAQAITDIVSWMLQNKKTDPRFSQDARGLYK